MATFYYRQALNDKQYRLLTLLHGAGDERIRCNLSTHAEGVDIPYEALSWTWGEEAATEHIEIEGASDRPETFNMKPNLYDALKRLRYPAQPRILWVDAICINQGNPIERDLQVKLMYSIYSRANNVCVWLGNHWDDSDRAFAFINESICDFGKYEEIIEDPMTADDWKALAALIDRPWFSRRWVVQKIALAKSARVYCGPDELSWTDLETAVSLFQRDAPRLSGLYRGMKKAKFDINFFGEVDQMGAARLIKAKQDLFRRDDNGDIIEFRATLTDLVSNLSSFDAKDPHDLVYAILSLASDTRNIRVPAAKPSQTHSTPLHADQPNGFDVSEAGDTTAGASEETPNGTHHDTRHSGFDPEQKKLLRKVADAFKDNARNPTILFPVQYENSFFIMCKQFLRFTVPNRAYPNLDILCRPWAPDIDEPLPSWIPRLSRKAFVRRRARHAPGGHQITRKEADPFVGQSTDSTPYYNASKNLKAKQRPNYHQGDDWGFLDDVTSDDHRLFVTGFGHDGIAKILPSSQRGNIPEDWLKLGGWHRGVSTEVPDALWRTLVADRGPDGRNTPVYYRAAMKDAIEHSIDGLETKDLKSRGHPVSNEFIERVEAVVTNRRLFRSSNGLLGLAPKEAAQGDMICIVKGFSVPIVLRKRADSTVNESRYTLIGECYLHTMMDGQAKKLHDETDDLFERFVLV